MKTILIRGREYKVERIEDATGNLTDDRIKYKLTGKRGAVYYTLRNVPNPGMMFIVPEKFTTRTMERVWVTDESGELTVVSQ